MNEPLTKTQQELRGRSVSDMSLGQLRDWIDVCKKMENWVGYNKARRGWRQCREEALAELSRRGVDLLK